MVFGPIPKPPFDVPGCLSANLTDATACTVPARRGHQRRRVSRREVAVGPRAGAATSTPQPWFCTTSTCAVMVDNLVVYRDDNHLTQTYASFLTPVVEPELELAMAGRPVVTAPAKTHR